MEMMLCPWESPEFLIFSSNIPTLLYYSHFVAILAALIFGLALIGRVRESSPARWFLVTIVLFSIWSAIDVLLWASNRPDIVLFYWNLQILLEILLYASAFYFAYVFIKQKKLAFGGCAVIALLTVPIIALLPTAYLLEGIDTAYCNALETPFVILYTYAFEILLSLTLLFIAFRQMHLSPKRAKEIGFFTLGTLFFLLAFSSGNIIGSLTDDWVLAQTGLFGMPIFIGFLAYTAVRFKTFNLKLFSAQILVVSLWLLTLSQLFIRTIDNIRIIVIVNLAKDLEIANQQQIILIHFITHQLKGFVTKSRNLFSMLLDGDYGQAPDEMKPLLEEGLQSDTKGVNTIQEILNAANIKSGKVTYAKSPLDLKELVKSIVNDLRPNADAKSLALAVTAEATDFTIQGDRMQLTNAVKNLIDNSIKYTLKGSVNVSLAREDSKVRLEINDTGVGITPEDMKLLFTEGGHGKESQKVNVESTGFGLYIVKNIIEAHQGKVWVESEGKDKGSRFIVELPVA